MACRKLNPGDRVIHDTKKESSFWGPGTVEEERWDGSYLIRWDNVPELLKDSVMNHETLWCSRAELKVIT